jgi:S1-C subfamily serine protease
MLKRLFAVGLALLASGCNWPIGVHAIVSDGEVFTGTVMGGFNRGSMSLTNGKGTECIGEYSGGIGLLNCNDGDAVQITYATLSVGSGYGFGTARSGRGLRFVFGMSAEEGARYLSPVTAGAAGGNRPATSGKTSSGTGFFITRQGHILTNAHVVDGCRDITVQQPGGPTVSANAVTTDKQNDLALLQTAAPAPAVATLRGSRPIRPGESVIAFGFPLSGMMSSGGVLTTGTVNALSGTGDDTRYLQISAPIQPGNSGGPLLDTTGAIVGVTTKSISTNRAARLYGATPQNVNFAIKPEVIRTFLATTGFSAESSGSGPELSPADVGERARAFTVHIVCKG